MERTACYRWVEGFGSAKMDRDLKPQPDEFELTERDGTLSLRFAPPDPVQYGFADQHDVSRRVDTAREEIRRSIKSIRRVVSFVLYVAVLVGYMSIAFSPEYPASLEHWLIYGVLWLLGLFVIVPIGSRIAESIKQPGPSWTHEVIRSAHEYRMARDKYDRQLDENRHAYLTALANYQETINRRRRDHWIGMDGLKFEREMKVLFERLGYRAELTPASGDSGVDLFLFRGEEKIVVQCKSHGNPVGPAVVRDLFGTMVANQAHEAFLVATGGFTGGVVEFSKDKPIRLMDLDWIVSAAASKAESIEEISPDETT